MEKTQNSQPTLLSLPWVNKLDSILSSKEVFQIGRTINELRKTKEIFPYREEVFQAFNLTPPDKVRIVILGQDCYPNKYQNEPVACGVAFKPRFDNCLPPSLEVIGKELERDLFNDFCLSCNDLDLEGWAKQGILLLNCALTVEANKPGSHLELWKPFIQKLIKFLNDEYMGLIFVFWGNEAKKYAPLINTDRHYLLTAGHPASELYGNGSFYNCKHFSKIDDLIEQSNGKEHKIKWLKEYL